MAIRVFVQGGIVPETAGRCVYVDGSPLKKGTGSDLVLIMSQMSLQAVLYKSLDLYNSPRAASFCAEASFCGILSLSTNCL